MDEEERAEREERERQARAEKEAYAQFEKFTEAMATTGQSNLEAARLSTESNERIDEGRAWDQAACTFAMAAARSGQRYLGAPATEHPETLAANAATFADALLRYRRRAFDVAPFAKPALEGPRPPPTTLETIQAAASDRVASAIDAGWGKGGMRKSTDDDADELPDGTPRTL